MSSNKIHAEFPDKLRCLFEPTRYKVLYGGRGGAKSWGIARALLIKGVERPIRVFCAREIQKSIKDSVHQLLKDQIAALGLGDHYEVLQAEIRGKNGTKFGFAGLRHNPQEIKSYEGADICWVEEAQAVSKSSWDILIPTIRKEGSEIWISFNPDLEDDETYQRFVINPPSNSVVVKVGWQDNPWFPEVLRHEKDELKVRDVDSYLHVWEGNCREILDGAIYANELRQMKEDDRLCKVPYDATQPVQTFWDLGWADCTSIWFAQTIGFEIRIIDFYQNQLQALPHYLQVLQNKPYLYKCHWLPHDARAKSLGTGKSIEELVRATGQKVGITPKLTINDGINAARTIFSQCYFDATKCADGINALRHYRYDVDSDTGKWSKDPLHDVHSHAADAFRYMAVAIKQPKKKTGADGLLYRPTGGSWQSM